MASVELQTGTESRVITHGRNLVRAGARLYAVLYDGTNLVYQYSDDNGATWSSETTIASSSPHSPSAFYDEANGRLNFVYAANGATAAAALRMRAITSNVTSGTPGSLTTETVIDAGGANVGVLYPYAWMSGGATPRYWIVGVKSTSAGTYETRAWYAAAGSGADTAGNWSTTNFTNLGGFSGFDAINHPGVGVAWTISGNERCTIIFAHGDNAQNYRAVTFDPTAGTPTPGSVTSIAGSGATILEVGANGPIITVAAKADYLVFGRFDDADDTFDFFKTVDGTTWSQPTGWDALTMGRASLTRSGSDFYLIHSDTYGATATTAQQLKRRKITASSDNMGSSVNFSDANGNGVATPIDTGTAFVYALYRGSTGSPYTIRSDLFSIVQIAVPNADSVDGSWTTHAAGTDLVAQIDETTPSDADYIRSEVVPNNSSCRVKLASLADPLVSGQHELHWRTGKDQASGPQIDMRVQLRQGGGNSIGGGTLIASFTRTNVGQALTTFVETLSGSEADAITDYADLYLEFRASQV